jgi:hypothetical protein
MRVVIVAIDVIVTTAKIIIRFKSYYGLCSAMRNFFVVVRGLTWTVGPWTMVCVRFFLHIKNVVVCQTYSNDFVPS